jgi:hypothetical protein
MSKFRVNKDKRERERIELGVLAQLKAAHDEIQASILRLEAVAQSDEPDRSELAIVRWKVMRASRARWRLLDDVVYPEIERRSLAHLPEVVALRADDADLIARASKHVAAWDSDQIQGGWSAYRNTATRIVAAMRDRQTHEKAVLYPLLADGVR